MKINTFFIVGFLLILIDTGYAQKNKIFIGPSISFSVESFTQVYYENGRQERNAENQFFGIGIRAQKKINRIWGIRLGIKQVTKEYGTHLPYNHCYFIKPGEACTYELRYVKSYGYKTLQFELGIMHYLISNSKVDLYINLSTSTSIDYESFYNENSNRQVIKNTKDHWFSNSLLGSIGLGFHLTPSMKIILEPFWRCIYTHRNDRIIHRNENNWSYFDNYGAQLSFMIRF